MPDETSAYVLNRNGRDLIRSDVTLTFGDGAFEFAMTDDETVAAELYPAGEGHAERRSLRTGALVSEGSGGAGSFKLQTAMSGDGNYVAVPHFSNTGSMPIFRTDRHAGGEGATPGSDRLCGRLERSPARAKPGRRLVGVRRERRHLRGEDPAAGSGAFPGDPAPRDRAPA